MHSDKQGSRGSKIVTQVLNHCLHTNTTLFLLMGQKYSPSSLTDFLALIIFHEGKMFILPHSISWLFCNCNAIQEAYTMYLHSMITTATYQCWNVGQMYTVCKEILQFLSTHTHDPVQYLSMHKHTHTTHIHSPYRFPYTNTCTVNSFPIQYITFPFIRSPIQFLCLLHSK